MISVNIDIAVKEMRIQIESIDNKKTEFHHTRKQIESIDNKKTEFYQTSSSFNFTLSNTENKLRSRKKYKLRPSKKI